MVAYHTFRKEISTREIQKAFTTSKTAVPSMYLDTENIFEESNRIFDILHLTMKFMVNTYFDKFGIIATRNYPEANKRS